MDKETLREQQLIEFMAIYGLNGGYLDPKHTEWIVTILPSSNETPMELWEKLFGGVEKCTSQQ